jgi:chromosome segregation ATPase
MSKRRTIGENPLDAELSENPLEMVIPAPQAPVAAKAQALQEQELEAARTRAAALEAENQDLRERLQALEGDQQALKTEAAGLQAQADAAQQRVAELEGENQGLKSEITRLQAELSLLREAAPLTSGGYGFRRRGN